MATILFASVGNERVTIIDIPNPNGSGRLHRCVETGFESKYEKIAINHGRKHLHKISGIKDREKPKKTKCENRVSWEYDSSAIKIEDEKILSIAEEIRKFKRERNANKNKKPTDKRIRSKRNVSGARLDKDWREVYRPKNTR